MMNRIQDKVKDIVEVRPYKGLRDFSADAQTTLESYCFTDDTTALMAKWLDAVASIAPHSGKALALAGYRGVGKSHFMATFGGIVSLPELRSKISNSYVSASAQGLLRRHYRLVNVRRGSRDTFLEELRDGIEKTYGSDIDAEDGSPEGLLNAALGRAGDLPLILVIDTALERGSRVSRNDGEMLARVAEFARTAHALVCVALDDDIAGADGSNSAIVRSYNIDFLDQEHLYKVVNSHIFPKYGPKEAVVTEIYNYFCKVVPNFRWSAQRFSSLYPLHPGILEVAPYVRLYVHDFALLSFASEAGERILGRPANSLIAFDEVFDKAEPALRKIADLTDAFAAYDRLNAEVVGKVPVIQRLQAKLILKALLLLSLNGQGATAEDICSSMLIFDENEPQKAVSNVKGIIDMFSAAMPDEMSITKGEGGESYYSFRVSAKENVNSALQAAAANIDPATTATVIRSLLQERFADLILTEEGGGSDSLTTESVAYWRGGQRRGRIRWLNVPGAAGLTGTPAERDFLDWEAIIDIHGSESSPSVETRDIPLVVWRADALKPEEHETLLKHHLLQTDSGLLEEHGEHLRASVHAHRVAAEKIVERIMLTNGQLVIDGFDYNFAEGALETSSISGLFSIMLEPLFETRFPLHPQFSAKLGMAEVSKLVSDLYDASRQKVEDVQAMARTFALPLALVRFEDGLCLPESIENLEKIPYISDVLELTADEASEGGSISLQKVYSHLRKPPYGLVREAQHLVLTALVANRKIEFVTSKGDRINARSLDLRIIWDDIVGIAKPVELSVSSKRLLKWAQLLTGDTSLKNLDDPGQRKGIFGSFHVWISEWDRAKVITRFDDVPDGLINTTYWANAARVRKTFGAVAEAIRTLLAAGDSKNLLEETLARVAEIFLDSEEEYKRSTAAVDAVEAQLASIISQQEILSYLSSAESTDDAEVEELRSALITALREFSIESGEAGAREIGYIWDQFRKSFSDHFALLHDQVMRSHDLQEKFDELRKTDIWWEFDRLSRIPVLATRNRRIADRISRQLNDLDCAFDVREALLTSPQCLCSFRLSDSEKWADLPAQLWSEVSIGQRAIRSKLRAIAPEMADSIRSFAENSNDPVEANAAISLLETLTASDENPRFSQMQLDILQSILDDLDISSSDSDNSRQPDGQKTLFFDDEAVDEAVDQTDPTRRTEEPALIEV